MLCGSMTTYLLDSCLSWLSIWVAEVVNDSSEGNLPLVFKDVVVRPLLKHGMRGLRNLVTKSKTSLTHLYPYSHSKVLLSFICGIRVELPIPVISLWYDNHLLWHFSKMFQPGCLICRTTSVALFAGLYNFRTQVWIACFECYPII